LTGTAIMGVPTMAQAKTFVALDVHVSATVAAIIDRDSGELGRQRLSGRGSEVCEFLAALPGRVRATYEAGPTGFALARRLQGAGVDCLVCAPGLIARGPSDRVKTDQRDAERLVRLLIAGELHRVAVPTIEAESLRDLVRAREDLRGDLMSARHRAAKLLLRHDVRFEGKQRNWTQPHLRWLSTVRFDQPGTQAAFDDYRGAVEALVIRRSELEARIAEQLPLSPWAQTAKRLMCLRGIDTLTAAGLCAEVGDFHRFRHPEQLMSFLGVVRSEHSSGTRRRQGSITSPAASTPAGCSSRRPGTIASPPGSANRCGVARSALTPRSSRCRGRPSVGCIASGHGWNSAASAARSSPSPPPASWPGSAGRLPPTNRCSHPLV
jgi:transposase